MGQPLGSAPGSAAPARDDRAETVATAAVPPGGSLGTWLTNRAVRLREHFPLTLTGLLTLGAALLALRVFGYAAMDLVAFALAVCAIAIVLCSMVCVIAGGVLLQVKVNRHLRTVAARRIPLEAGFPNESGFQLPLPAWLPLIRVSWQVVFPDDIVTRIGQEGDLLVETLIPESRCRTTRIVRRFSVSDVLGFSRYQWRQSQSVDLCVLPRSHALRALPVLRSLTAEDGLPSQTGNPEGDRMEIRPYVAGDSVRNIMWKVYARTGELNVRLPEKSVFHSNRTLAYLISGPGDEAAAAVARLAVESGALGDDWLFCADGTDLPCSEVAPALEAIAASRALERPLALGLGRFLLQAGTRGGGHCIVFAAARPGPWVTALRQDLARFAGRVTLVLATDGIIDASPTPVWQRWLWRNVDDATRHRTASAVPRTELAAVLTDTGQLVESLLVVDRATGQYFDRGLRRI